MANIALIPARCGSKSIPMKNIKSFCGRPLIYWTLIALEKCKLIETVFVATDCDAIIETVEEFRFSKVHIYIRDEANATDAAPSENVILEFLNKKKYSNEDVLIFAQATSPFTRPEDFEKAIQKYIEAPNIDSLLTCVRVKRFFWHENGLPINYDYTQRPRRQEFEGVMMENGAFYINTVGNILKYRNRLCGNILIHEMPEISGIELDEINDWDLAEFLFRKHIRN